MKKIDAKEVARLVTGSRDLSRYFEEIDTIVSDANEKIAAVLSNINEAKEEVRGILDDAANDAESYYDERSERWQEGDTGQAYDEWKNRLRELADAAAEDLEPPEVAAFEVPEWVNDCAECEFSEFEG